MKASYKRRNYLIDKAFQLHYVGIVFLFCLLITGAILFSFYFGFRNVIYDQFSWKSLLSQLKVIDRVAGTQEMHTRYNKFSGQNGAVDIEQSKMQREATLLGRKQEELFSYMLVKIMKEVSVLLIALIIIVCLGTIFLTHKIAGPIYRIRMLLKQVHEGNLNVVFKLREEDQLQGLANSLNEVFADYRKNLKNISEVAEEIKVKCQVMEQKTQDEEIKSAVGDINYKLHNIQNICHQAVN